MTTRNILTQPIDRSALLTRMGIGAGIGLVLIGLFLIGAGEPNPAWPALWRIRPLVIVPLAGATGGAFYYFVGQFGYSGWKKILVNLLCLFVFVIGLWLGTVLGLDGTYWD
jgi:hypothetical protein